MDPLVCVPAKLHDWIFQHLRGKDFKKITRVSPSWNEILGKSRAIMKKVKLSIGKHKIDCENMDRLKTMISSNSRRFQNVSIRFSFDILFHKFTTILLDYVVTLGSNRLLKLELHSLHELTAEDLRCLDEIVLSRLEVLKLEFVSEEVTSKLLGHCQSLIELDLTLTSKGEFLIPIPILKSFVERNQSLKSMKLAVDCYKIFHFDISNTVSFKLKHLTIDNGKMPLPEPEDIEYNVLNFLAQQSSTLESLDIHECSAEVIEHIFNKMPVLKKLSIHNSFRKNRPLKVNETIVDLSIPKGDLGKVVRAVPKLRKLFVDFLTFESLEIIARELPELQTLLFVNTTFKEHLQADLWPEGILRKTSHKEYSHVWSFER